MNSLLALTLMAGTAAAPADSLHTDSLQQVQVVERRAATPQTHGDGRIYWQMEQLEHMPHLLGNADPLRMLRLLPGVGTANDYASGLQVQGCAPSHTLVSLDGATLFNPSHLLGLFSTLVTSHYRGMALTPNRHQASFPHRLGGHLAFYPLDTLATRPHLDATLSFMESEGTLTLPTGSRGTLYLSARGSYLNLLYSGLLKIDGAQTNYALQDYTLTYVLHPTARDVLRLTAYHGTDRLSLEGGALSDDNRIDWQNTAAALSWQHHLPQGVLSQQATLSRYANALDMGYGSMLMHTGSDIMQATYRGTMDWQCAGLYCLAGAEYQYTELHPLHYATSGSSIQATLPRQRHQGHEANLMAQCRLTLPLQLELDASLRAGLVSSRGMERLLASPRVTLRRTMAQRHQLSAHYGLYHQPLHQVDISPLGLPVNYWELSSTQLRPQYAHSWVLAYQWQSAQRTYSLEAEVYYKRLYRQYEYNSSIMDLLTDSQDYGQGLIQGDGRNYGLNLMVRRTRGALTGWISYALSRSQRRYADLGGQEWLDASQNRLHDLAVVAHWQVNRHWSLGGDFVYASGTPYTRVNALYLINSSLVYEYGRYNAARLPATHHLDLSLSYHLARRGRCRQSLNLSVYNVYARRNVIFSYLSADEESQSYGYRQVHSLCRMLPSIGYHLQF